VKRRANKTGIDLRISYSVSQNKRSLSALVKIQEHFKCGTIRFDKKDQVYKYDVRKLSDLMSVIVPHFEKYPLINSKQDDFVKFRDICHLVHRKYHLNHSGLKFIIKIARSMDSSLFRKKKYTKEELFHIIDKSQSRLFKGIKKKEIQENILRNSFFASR